MLKIENIHNLPSNYGDVLDNDCLILVLSYFPLRDVCVLRTVCKKWNEVATSNALWSRFQQEYFSGAVLEKENATPNYYFGKFLELKNRIPVANGRHERLDMSTRQHPQKDQYLNFCTLESLVSSGDLVDADVEELNSAFSLELEDDTDYLLDFERLHYSSQQFTVNCKPEEVTMEVHKLAVIMHMLHENGYAPKLSDWVLIGHSVRFRQMSLLNFCHHILCSTKPLETPADDDELGLDPLQNQKKSLSHEQWRKLFKPFVWFHPMDGQKIPLKAYLNNPDLLRIVKGIEELFSEQVYGPRDGVSSAYFWSASSDGDEPMSPPYFNASFQWHGHFNITSVYNTATNCIIVTNLTKLEVW